MILRKSHLTLIELLIVLSIFVLILSVVGININKAIREQRFRSEVSRVVDQLQLAQDLMLIVDADVRIKFKAQDEGIKMWMEVSEKISKSWAKENLEKPKILKTIQYIGFKDPIKEKQESGQSSVQFLSGGSLMSYGVMRLATSKEDREGKLEKFICLTGYPRPIESVSSYPKMDPQEDDQHAKEFDQNLTNFIFQEIIADSQSKDEVQEKK